MPEHDNKHRVWAVVPAAGIGRRMQSVIPKQYLLLNGRPVLEYSINSLLANQHICGLVIALQPDDVYWAEVNIDSRKPVIRAPGGKQRADSVLNALQALYQFQQFNEDSDWVMVHDAVRPCLRQQDIDRLVHEVAADVNGGLLAMPVRDTMKRQSADAAVSVVAETVEREFLWQALTPQYFPAALLKKLLQQAAALQQTITDESSAMELAGFSPRLVPGHEDNIKITRPDDLKLAALYLQAQHNTPAWQNNRQKVMDDDKTVSDKTAPAALYRIGHGYDVHRFGEGDYIMLGAVKIPYHHGFIAHSDGDVLIHSLCDALLGSVGAGDIGQHFPDTDERYKNIDSRELLSEVNRLLQEQQFSIANIDLTIVAQRPKMSPYIQSMRQRLSAQLCIDISQINVKATTTENLGFTGREEGIAVHAVVMVYRNRR